VGDISIFVDGSRIASDHVVVTAAYVDSPNSVRASLADLRRTLLSDALLSQLSSVQALQRRGFQYGDDHSAVREKVLAVLGGLGYQAEVWFGDRSGHVDAELSSVYREDIVTRVMARVDRFAGSRLRVYVRDAAEEERLQALVQLLSKLPRAASLSTDELPRIVAIDPHDLCFSIPSYLSEVIREAIDTAKAPAEADVANLAQTRYKLISAQLARVADVTRDVVFLGHSFSEELHTGWRRA
jgi:hypothetical protein